MATRFRGCGEAFKKATSNGTVSVLDLEFLRQRCGQPGDALLRQIDSEGRRLNLRVDRGEAYTHAAAAVLGALVATNDATAVHHLMRDRETVHHPVLRFWDLIVFARQIDQLNDGACDRIRQTPGYGKHYVRPVSE